MDEEIEEKVTNGTTATVGGDGIGDGGESGRPPIEVKIVRDGVREVKQAERNGVRVGIVAGYIATWDVDTGGAFGVPDRFVRGAFARSLQEHRERGNRQIRLKDHHGRTIGGFPIETAREDEIGLFAVGEVNLETQLGRESHALARQNVLTDLSIGFSSEADSVEDGVRVISQAIVWEGSIVDEPANRAAVITEVKTVVPFQDLPLADRDRRWDSRAAIGRVRRFTDSTDEPSRDYRRAFVWYDRADAQNFGAYKLPIADVVDDRLVAVPRGIFAAAGALRGARGGVDIPDADRPRARRHLERYFAKMDLDSPFDERSFFGVEEAKRLGGVEFERALRDSGSFSKAAARILASRLGDFEVQDEVRYDCGVVASILDELEGARRLLAG